MDRKDHIKNFVDLGDYIVKYDYSLIDEIGYFTNKLPTYKVKYIVKLSSVTAAIVLGNEIQIWNLQTQKCDRVLQGHTDEITILKKYKDMLVSSGSKDHTIKI